MRSHIFVSAAVLSFAIHSCKPSKEVQQLQPNIIFILADDMSYRDLSAWGQERYKTPNLDSLAVNGIRFTQSYSAAPECAPARGCIMTGLHTGHGPIRMNSSARGQDNLRDEDLTIAEVLKEAGYTTGFTGKWGIGLPGTEGVPYKQGFDFAFGFYDQTRAHTYIPYFLWRNDQKVEYPQNKGFNMDKRYDYKNAGALNTYDEKGRLHIDELSNPYEYVYSENEVEKAALDFINDNDPHKTHKPFFLYYATQLPHGPVIVDELGSMTQPVEIDQLSREWAAMVMKLDKFVGTLINSLKESGNYENTIIFFASDNGYSMCGYTGRGNAPNWPDDPWLRNKGPFTGGKFSVLEGGCRVPFFISWPSKIKAATIDEPVWLPDFFPTAVELSGGNPANYQLDAISLMPIIEGKADEFPGHEFLYFSRGPEQAVRIGGFKAYRANPKAAMEIYLVEEDTYTQRNLAALYPEVVKRAEEIMETEHISHEWYRNPNESFIEYQQKIEKAKATGNILPVYRPNDVKKFPWETE